MNQESITPPGDIGRVEKFSKHYNEPALWKKIHSLPRSCVKQILERVLLLRELLLDAKTPIWVRGTLVGAIGYCILPFDLCPDFIPGVGYLDDLAMMSMVLGSLDYLVTDEIKSRVKKRMGEDLPEPQ